MYFGEATIDQELVGEFMEVSKDGITKSSLKVHQEAVHEGITHFCNQCDFKASQIHNLQVHKQRKHFH
jgi:hypothetical protein